MITSDKIKSIKNCDLKLIATDYNFDYQDKLTKKLDKFSSNLNQETINEIVLWKVNRYVELRQDTLLKLNAINKTDKAFDEVAVRVLLKELLTTKGIKIAMASTILRYKNPNLFQIIDQRVYRILYGQKMKTTSSKNLEENISTYLKYLIDLREACKILQIPFDSSDRILYMADKRINGDIKLDNY